jgi:plastocyanin
MQSGRIAGIALGLCVAGVVPAHAETVQIVMDKMVFMPAEATAKVGDTIEWINRDFLQHSATANDHSFDIVLAPRKSGHIVVNKPGDIDYICKYHPNMKGRIKVAP